MWYASWARSRRPIFKSSTWHGNLLEGSKLLIQYSNIVSTRSNRAEQAGVEPLVYNKTGPFPPVIPSISLPFLITVVWPSSLLYRSINCSIELQQIWAYEKLGFYFFSSSTHPLISKHYISWAIRHNPPPPSILLAASFLIWELTSSVIQCHKLPDIILASSDLYSLK